MDQSAPAEANGPVVPASVAGPSEPRFSRPPRPGEPAPWFRAATPDNPAFNFDTVAGRRVVLCFLGDMPASDLCLLLKDVQAARSALAAVGCVFFGVSTATDDSPARLFKELLPDGYLFLDRDRAVSRSYGVASGEGELEACRPASFVMDERLRLVDVVPLVATEPAQHLWRVLQALQGLPVPEPERIVPAPAPILVVPRVFEATLCQALIRYYEREGGEQSGFMRDVGNRTVLVHDPRHKRRRDRTIEDEKLLAACRSRIRDRLVPEIAKAFQFTATRIERYIVACYEAEDAGHFRAHRDNTTRGTAHRRFAVSLNLNTGDYEGGLLRFPEFGRQMYQPPAGGAVVFSCSLLHEATPVSKGKRYAFLPFLYDDVAADVREKNRGFL